MALDELLYEADLSTDPDSPFVRDGANISIVVISPIDGSPVRLWLRPTSTGLDAARGPSTPSLDHH